MLKNNRGVTLLELISALALLSTILILANSFHLFGQKQMSNQTSQIENQENVRYALNVMTKEIRSADKIEVSEGVLVLNDSDHYKLDLETNTLSKNNISIVTGIKQFTITNENNKINLTISSIPDKLGQSITLSTVIYVRN